MWLLTSFIAAVAVTIIWHFISKKYNLGVLCLMLWGLTVMVFIDHILGYESGTFLKVETDGLISNGIILGIIMLFPIFLIWELSVLHSRYKRKIAMR